jgi:hypothetical protein
MLHLGTVCSASRLGNITHWIGGCVGFAARLDPTEKEKILPLPVFEPWPSSSQPVAIPTELSRLQSKQNKLFFLSLMVFDIIKETGYYAYFS